MTVGSTQPLVKMSIRNILGVKAAGGWGWQPHHLHAQNVMKIWESKPPGTLWVTPGLLRGSTFLKPVTRNTDNHLCMSCSWVMYKFKPVHNGCVEVMFLEVCCVSRSVRLKSELSWIETQRNRKAGNLPRILRQNIGANIWVLRYPCALICGIKNHYVIWGRNICIT